MGLLYASAIKNAILHWKKIHFMGFRRDILEESPKRAVDGDQFYSF